MHVSGLMWDPSDQRSLVKLRLSQHTHPNHAFQTALMAVDWPRWQISVLAREAMVQMNKVGPTVLHDELAAALANVAMSSVVDWDQERSVALSWAAVTEASLKVAKTPAEIAAERITVHKLVSEAAGHAKAARDSAGGAALEERAAKKKGKADAQDQDAAEVEAAAKAAKTAEARRKKKADEEAAELERAKADAPKARAKGAARQVGLKRPPAAEAESPRKSARLAAAAVPVTEGDMLSQ